MAHAGGRPRKDISLNISEISPQKYLTVSKVEKITGLHRHTIQARLRDGTLRGKKIGGIWKIFSKSIVNDKVVADFNIERR